MGLASYFFKSARTAGLVRGNVGGVYYGMLIDAFFFRIGMYQLNEQALRDHGISNSGDIGFVPFFAAWTRCGNSQSHKKFSDQA
jgi:hypothetical protein